MLTLTMWCTALSVLGACDEVYLPHTRGEGVDPALWAEEVPPLRPCWTSSNSCLSIKESSPVHSVLTAEEEGCLVEVPSRELLQPSVKGTRVPRDPLPMVDCLESDTQEATGTRKPKGPDEIHVAASRDTVGSSPG